MQYRIIPKPGGNDARSLIESATGSPAREELALCRVSAFTLNSVDSKLSVKVSGPYSCKELCVSEMRSALGGYAAGFSIEVLYLPIEKDEWVKDNWKDIVKAAAEQTGLNVGSILACEPSWGEFLEIAVPSDAQVEAMKKKKLPEFIKGSIGKITGICPEIKFSVASSRQRDYSGSLAPAPELPSQQIPCEDEREAVLGSRIRLSPSPIDTGCAEDEYIVFEGEIIKAEVFTSRRHRTVLSFVLADDTGSISCKYFSESADVPTLPSHARVAGKLALEERQQEGQTPELFLMVEDLEELSQRQVIIDRLCHRVELHCHSKMSALDSVCDPDRIAQFAAIMGQSAIALTDHGVVHAFPAFSEACRRNGIKPIFGMEGYMKSEGEETSHITVLVKNKRGLSNLYKMVSASHLEHFKRHPLLPKDVILKHREGLILGSACASGEVFKAILSGTDDLVMAEIMAFYDYIEIMPAENSAFLIREGKLESLDAIRRLNSRLVAIAKSIGKPFVATGDVHYLSPSDSVLRKVLLSGQDFKDVESQPALHLRSTDEMISEFSYLSHEDCLEAVIISTNRIAAMIEPIKPVPDGLSTPIVKGAEEDVKSLTHAKAMHMYGNPPPGQVRSRIEKELSSIIGNGFASIYMIATRLVRKSLEDGYLVGSRGSVGSSLVACMLGITEVNPLPPHYRCPSCCHSDFGPFSEKHGFDLPEKACPRCGAAMSRDGHDIPFEVFLGFEGDKVPDIDLNFSGEYQPRIHKYCEEMFGSDNVFRAGTIGTIAEKTAYGFVRAFEEHTGSKVSRAQSTRLAVGTSGVRRTTGQHPGGIIVLPDGMDIHDFTPVQHPANSKEKGIITTHFEYTALHDNLLKLDLLGHDDPTMIRMLEDITGRSFRDLPYDDGPTMSIFSGVEGLGIEKSKYGQEVGTIGIPEFGTRFVRGMLSETRPSTFDELVRISGLSHGTNVWLDNAQEVIRRGDGTLREVISVRDDIMNYLIEKGMKHKTAFQIMEKVRKGRGLSLEDEKSMKAIGVPLWYIDSCNKIKYMFPKAHACAYVMMAFRIAFAKVHMPEAFYCAFLSIRAADFDPHFSSMGARDLDRKIRSIDANRASTQKEKDTVPVLEVVREALLRGISIKPVDLMLSDPLKFVSEGGGIRAPLVSVSRLGVKPAEAIAYARKEGSFDSVEELKERAALGKSHLDALRDAGALLGMRESKHMGLF